MLIFGIGPQPIVFWLSSLPYLLNSLIEKIPYYIPPEQSVKAAVIVLALFSLYLTLKMLALASKQLDDGALKTSVDSLFMPLSGGYLMAMFCTRFELGNTQQLFMLCLIPWLTQRWLSYSNFGFKSNTFWPFVVGILAALGAILDLPHLPVIILLELFFAAALRQI